tara:strand:- start:668 stop:964 length:297 start_codon:yes stop_codon:yes gene_type:complete
MGEVTQVVTFRKAGYYFDDRSDAIEELVEDMNAIEYIAKIDNNKAEGQHTETLDLTAPDTLVLTREWNLKSEYDAFIAIDFSQQRKNLEDAGWTITDE